MIFRAHKSQIESGIGQNRIVNKYDTFRCYFHILRKQEPNRSRRRAK